VAINPQLPSSIQQQVRELCQAREGGSSRAAVHAAAGGCACLLLLLLLLLSKALLLALAQGCEAQQADGTGDRGRVLRVALQNKLRRAIDTCPLC
jgi:hypothetical protein